MIKDLIQKGEERKRLTKKFVELVTKIADEIAVSLQAQVGTIVEVGGVKYRVFLGAEDDAPYLAVYEIGGWHVIWKEPDRKHSVYVVEGFHVESASKQSYLHFANNVQAIVQAFNEKEEERIKQLEEAINNLEQWEKNKAGE